MERESLLGVLILLLAGVALQAFGPWLPIGAKGVNAAELEHRRWVRLWLPVVPALGVAAWLCGWALAEPDPVPDRLDRWVLFAASAPFLLLFGRAAGRAVWSLLRRPAERGVATVGLVRPQVVVSPLLAKELDHRALLAALEHERAHAAHRDPLRIWAAQLITDLQWPWPAARRRLESWLSALELARDDEVRAGGVEGADLAAAVLASVRFLNGAGSAGELGRAIPAVRLPATRLFGAPSALRARVLRLLEPPAESVPEEHPVGCGIKQLAFMLVSAMLCAVVLGAVFGERIVHSLLALT